MSVRSVDEVGPALAGGADIIDAKEPDRGSLGAVDAHVLKRILQRIPDRHSVSVALGDVTRPEEVLTLLRGLVLSGRALPTYLKFGFAGVRSSTQIGRLIETAVSAVSTMNVAPHIVAVAYADSESADTVSPVVMPPLARAAGASAVLLDTYGKNGRGLLEWVARTSLEDWVGLAQSAGLLAGLAGGLAAPDLDLICAAGADVVGIRGAACTGGRWGRVSEEKVRQFRLALDGAVRGTPRPSARLRETRDSGAISSGPTGAKSLKLNA